MNFTFSNQRKMNLGQPIIRHLSTCLVATTPPDHKFFKPDFLSKLPTADIIRNFSSNVIPNKSFSNPNFVNKNNPNILTSGALICNYKVPVLNYQEVKHVNKLQQPKHLEKRPEEEKREEIEPQIVSSQIISEEVTEANMPMTFSKSERDIIAPTGTKQESFSPKTNKKIRKNRRRRRGAKRKENLEGTDKQKMVAKKNNSPAVSPKKLKKDGDIKTTHNRKNKKYKPWHKISLAMEIQECNEESVVFTPNSPKDETDFVSIKSQPIDINKSSICMTISPCKEFFKSLSSSNTSDVSTISSASPCFTRLRIPSECDSEDSFIVFCEDPLSCDVSSEEDSFSEVDSEVDCIFDVDFIEKTDLNKDTARKKVSFKCEPDLCEVHPMIKWGFAYHNARIGPWEQLARDRARFETRIQNIGRILSPILQEEHRNQVYKDRFEDLG